VSALALVLIAVLAQVRDAAPAATGTAMLVGTVTTEETPPRPLRRAVVTANSTDPRVGRTAVTDDAGRFAFVNLPPGRYTLTGTKRGWVTTSYGAKAPGRPGRSIPVAQGERVTASLSLGRAAVITGTILDSTGGVPAGIAIRVMKYSYFGPSGERRLTQTGASFVGPDERGQYRIYGLTPGEYYVAALGGPVFIFATGSDLHLTTDVDVQEATKAVAGGPSAPITDVPQRTVALLPTFYPGTASPAQATPIAVRAGEERTGVDFTVQYTGAARVDGTIAWPGGGEIPAGTQVSLTLNDPQMPSLGFDGFRSARPGTDGHFEFAQVAPGPYLLVARAALPPAQGTTTPLVYSAAMDLDMQSEDQHGLQLTLEDTLTISGSVQYDGDGPRPSLAGVRVNLQPATQGTGVTVTGGGNILHADGTFTLTGVTPGRYRLLLSQPVAPAQTPWIVRSATLAGQEALDVGVDVRQSIADATIVLTNHVAELTGKVDAANGADYTLVLFPQNRDYWGGASRRIMTTRTAKDGSYSFRRVPTGDYALAPVDDVEPGEWFDPAFLQRLAPTAIKVTIGEGEKKVQDIHVGGH
jgi:protocatechuate 3,4-dioxygenase beta subunit